MIEIEDHARRLRAIQKLSDAYSNSFDQYASSCCHGGGWTLACDLSDVTLRDVHSARLSLRARDE